MPLPEFLAVKPSLIGLFLTCIGGDESCIGRDESCIGGDESCIDGDESCISEFARSAESRLRLRLEAFGVVSKDGSGRGKAGRPRIIIKARIFVAKAATIK